MGMKLTPTNLLHFISILSPFLLGFFLVMSSIFNQDMKGLVYLAGILIASVINVFLMNILNSHMDPNASPVCNIIDFSLIGDYNSPCMTSMIIAFTMSYLLLPMRYNQQMNYVVIVSLIALFIINMLTKVFDKCTTYGGSLLGGVVGFMLGAVWYVLFHANGYDSLLYFDEFISNNTVCKRPRKQTFKCSVYKNGELIDSNIV